MVSQLRSMPLLLANVTNGYKKPNNERRHNVRHTLGAGIFIKTTDAIEVERCIQIPTLLEGDADRQSEFRVKHTCVVARATRISMACIRAGGVDWALGRFPRRNRDGLAGGLPGAHAEHLLVPLDA